MKEISRLFHRFTRNNNITMYLIAFLFLPGTIIHELSHFIMAKLLFVYAGKIRLTPKFSGNEMTMGTAEVGKTDFIRQFLIGAAPFLFGTSSIIMIIYLTMKYSLTNNSWLLIAILYIVFIISNTMFSSKKDMEGALRLFAIISSIIFLLYFTGIRISINNVMTHPVMIELFQKGCLLLLIPITIDVLIVLILKITNTYL